MSTNASIANFTPRQRQLTLAALMVVFLLGALDQTVVSTAMPRIISRLNGLSLYAWVTTAYLLTSTVMVPIYGKLGDQFGRKSVLIHRHLDLLGRLLAVRPGRRGPTERSRAGHLN